MSTYTVTGEVDIVGRDVCGIVDLDNRVSCVVDICQPFFRRRCLVKPPNIACGLLMSVCRTYEHLMRHTKRQIVPAPKKVPSLEEIRPRVISRYLKRIRSTRQRRDREY
jgi:hypothetical protein